MPSYAHDLQASIVVVRGQPIPSSSEDEFISFEFPEEFFTATSGSGDRVRSMNPARFNGRATITVMRHSVAHKRLAALWEQQKASTVRATTATLPDGPFTWTDRSTGDSISAESAAIERAPSPSVGVRAGTVQWVIDLAGCKRTFAANILDTPSLG